MNPKCPPSDTIYIIALRAGSADTSAPRSLFTKRLVSGWGESLSSGVQKGLGVTDSGAERKVLWIFFSFLAAGPYVALLLMSLPAIISSGHDVLNDVTVW